MGTSPDLSPSPDLGPSPCQIHNDKLSQLYEVRLDETLGIESEERSNSTTID